MSSPASPLPVSLIKEHLDLSNPFTDSSTYAPRLCDAWSIGNLYMNKTSQIGQLPTSIAQADDEKQLQQSMGLLSSNEEHQQGQDFAELPSPMLDNTWSMLSEAQVTNLEDSLVPVEAPHQSSSTCQLKLPDADKDGRGFSEHDDRNIGSKFNGRSGLRQSSLKRDREEFSEGETTVTVVFQKMKPGRDKKKAIPDDDHRGWKKYGNKTIQNSNFCRGYYKCGMVDCRAKKMVQPTVQDPSIFEVTYVGKHTCSGSSRRRHRSRTVAPPPHPPPTIEGIDVLDGERQSSADEKAGSSGALYTSKPSVNGSSDVRVQTKIARLLKNHGGNGVIEAVKANSLTARSNNKGSPEDDQVSKDSKSWSSRSSKQMLLDNNSVEPNDSNETDPVPEDHDHEEGTYLQHSYQHQQSSYSFQQESLLWPEINMDASTLSTADPN
ncbi:uncharacterized protein [Physcomitrium patens]|uniref:WRKY domain-containing protein n=2 Tax=Physcomitrium patens TaxID=3218 RepID=A0A2K1JHC6_PHYPA|nr:probable WRKY transcription factor 35 [Physcomitrium patens]PNR40952.1 hypothetical protein PHYPA_018355 [Physcomitrium patens]|eukprot:XP_024394073.1 probable WRKY transcription factor 35 [Physcomitrella patens]